MIYAELERAAREADPLRYYRAASRAAEWIYRHIAYVEPYNHAANQAGKSTVAAGLAAALARGRDSIAAFDGSPIPLPHPEPPIRVGIGTPTYKLGGASILEALERLLGASGWKVNGTSSVYSVRHDRDRGEWTSEIIVFPYDGPVPEAVRLDAWIADENPPIPWLHAIRNRGKAGRRLYGGIFATPIDAREWEPVKAEYPEEPERPDAHGRARIQSSVYDNRFLHEPGCPGHDLGVGYCGCTCPAIVRQERANEGMADAPARLRGEHVNTVGGCPYAPEMIERWLQRCRDPLDVYSFVVQGERDGKGGLDAVALKCDLQVWRDAEENDEYILIADVGRGIDDGQHDPDAIHVRSRRDRALCARANAFLGPWGLGMAALETARAYKNAEIFVCRGGGYGEAVLSALRISGYRRVGSNMDSDRMRQVREQLGVTENTETRIKAMQAVASMLQRGRDDIPSRDVIKCFANCIVDKDGKITKRYGYHIEDLILAGHGNRILDLLGALPAYKAREKSSSEEFREAMERDGWRGVRPQRSGVRGPVDIAKW